MDFMTKEMQEKLKKDIITGKIYGLKLVSTPIEAIRRNQYAKIFEEVRPVVEADDERFILLTRRQEPHYLPGTYDGTGHYFADFSIPDQKYCDAEAYYSAFDYYDGHTLKSIVNIPSAVNEKDRIQITVYEVVRSY